MKIALLTDGIYPYVIGGMQKHSYLLAKYLAKNKIEVDLYHTNQSKFDISKLELFSVDEKKYITSIVIDFPSLGKMPGHYIRESYEYSVRVFNELRKRPPVDFVYAKGFSAWKLLDEKRKGNKTPPIGVNFHGYEMFQKPASLRSKLEQIFLLRKPTLFNISNADRVFSYGGKISDILLGLGIEKKRILEIPAGIESDWLSKEVSKSQGPRSFIFAGRYERRKGVEELNKALLRLIGKHTFEFHFIGAIPENKKIVSDQVIYHGLVTDSERLKSLLVDCDVLVCPSHSEGMPNVILEAMASGLAVIATDVGAVSEMVSGKNGILVKDADPDRLVEAFVQAMKFSDKELVLLKKHSLELVREKFIWDKLIAELIQKIDQTERS